MLSEPPNPRYPLTWEANLMVVAVLILVLLGGAITAASSLTTMMIFAQAFVIVPALLWIAIRRLPMKTTFRLHRIDRRLALWSALVGLVCWPVVSGMSTLIERWLALIGPGPQFPNPTGPVECVIYALVLIILAPITEEPVFRGFVLSAWLRRGTKLGLVMSALLFAVFHFQLAALVPLTFLGFVLGLLVFRSNSLYSSMIAHACYNTVGTLFIIVPTLREAPDLPLVIAGAIAFPIAVWLLWAFARRFSASTEAPMMCESSHWVWTVLSLMVALSILCLVIVSELFLRLSPNFISQ